MKSKNPPLAAVEKCLHKLLVKGVDGGVFPAAAAAVILGTGQEKREVFSWFGNGAIFPEKRKLQKKTFFDLASLTKPLATTLAFICLENEEKITIDEGIYSLLRKKTEGDKGSITARSLLSHSSGLPAHREYFTLLKNIPEKERKEAVINMILQEPLAYEPGSRSVYSDLGFILLGRIIEKKARCSLDEYVAERVLKPLQLEKKIFFRPLITGGKGDYQKRFAATENCPWRKKILCGEVHDDNCYTLGGVAGHSGLFGNIEGVAGLAGTILDIWKGAAEHPNIKREKLAAYLEAQPCVPQSTWALGFDRPAPKDSSSGNRFSGKSVGHLGFTGTSFWIDPEKDIVIVLLSNRVHPVRNNTGIKKFRPFFHNRIMEELFPAEKNCGRG